MKCRQRGGQRARATSSNATCRYSPIVAISAASKPDTTAYIQAVNTILGHGDSTEHSFRPALKSWVESFTKDVSATNEPKQAEHNAPDFDVKVQRGHGVLSIGKIEAKDVGTDLGKIEKDSEKVAPRTANGNQLKRYRRAFANLIFTDNVEFRWYQNGELKLTASLSTMSETSLEVSATGAEDCEKLIKAFIAQQPVKITSAKALAERMAAHSAVIQDVLSRALKAGQGPGKVVFQQVSSSCAGRAGSRAWCRVARAMSVVPARRRTLIAVERREAMTRGALPVRTADRSSS